MKKRIILLVLIGIGLMVLIWSPTEEESACGFCDYDLAIYYNAPTEVILRDLGNYHRVILESHFYDSKMIEYLNRKAVETYGYMSLVEINSHDTLFLSLLDDGAFISDKGVKRTNMDKTAFYMDIRNAQYQSAFLEILEERIVEKGFQGVFLDTVDLLEQFPEAFDDYQMAYSALLREIKARYPDLKIMQNRGFLSLEKSHTYIDVLLWENFQASDTLEGCDYEWYMKQISQVNMFRDAGLLVIAEVEAGQAMDLLMVKRAAEANGYIFQEIHSDHYMTWEILDPRYLLVKR